MKLDVVVQVLTTALAPDLGANMTRASILGLRDRLGLAGPEISDADVARFLSALEPGLTVFVGRARAERLLADVRRELGVTGRPHAR